jgi:hypothetical protein
MNGKIIALGILVITAVFAGAQWWFQTRAYYEPVALETLPVTLSDGETVNLQLVGAEAIDADTSPLRFRACLSVGADIAARLVAQGVPAEEPTPLIAPDWFGCFDAAAIGAALEAGAAQAIVSQTEVRPGADRIMAVYPDGRVYVWHQWNGSLEG